MLFLYYSTADCFSYQMGKSYLTSFCFCQLCTEVITLFSQVEVADVIRVNGSDFVPADAVILSSRYRSPICCQAVGTSLSLFFLFAFLSFSILPKEVMVEQCPVKKSKNTNTSSVYGNNNIRCCLFVCCKNHHYCRWAPSNLIFNWWDIST